MRETNLPDSLSQKWMSLPGRCLAACLGLLLGACAHTGETRTVEWSTEAVSAYIENCYAAPNEQKPWTDLLPKQALSVRFRPDFQADKQGGESERRGHCLYSAELGVMNEARLWPTSTSTESYRFTWLRSFHVPVVIRVERSGGVAQLHVKQLGAMNVSSDGTHTGRLTVDRSRTLTSEEWSQLALKLQAANFWGLKVRHATGDKEVYADGASWLLEGTRSGLYRAYDAFSPEEEGEAGAFRAACLQLVELAGLSIPEDEVY